MRTRLRLWHALAWLAVAASGAQTLVAGAASAFAAEPPSAPGASSDADLERAEQLFREGNDAVGRGELKEGRAKYLEAWKLKQSFDLAANLGGVELALGLARDAAQHLRFSVRAAPMKVDPEKLAMAKQKLADAKSKIATVTVAVNLTLTGIEILVDEQSLGHAPLGDEVYVEPGKRQFTARLAGYKTARSERELKAGETSAVALVLEPEPAATSGGVSWPVAGTGFAVGGAALIAAAVLTGVANAKASDVKDAAAAIHAAGKTCPLGSTDAECAALADAGNARASLSNAALGMWITAGAVLAATGIYTGAAVASAGAPVVALAPVISPGEAGLVLSGSF